MTSDKAQKAQLELLQRMWKAYSPTVSRNDIEEEREILTGIEALIEDQDVEYGSPWEADLSDNLIAAIEDYLREVEAPINFIPDPALRRLREAVESA